MGAILYVVLGLLTGLRDALRGLRGFLTATPTRLAFAVLAALLAFLCWRLSSIDGDRDAWRAKTEEYEAASKAVAEANERASKAAIAVTAETKGQVDATNQRAANDAARSDDPLRAGLDRLRSEGRGKSD